MAVGVFGKLPARRDYVQHGVDPQVMRTFDPWLQSAMAESRRALGDVWLDHWLLSPIWRFWLGRRIAGRPVLGALMPSVDGIGRYFPLCVLADFDDVPPPAIDEQAEWFAAVEALLLAALDEKGSYEALIGGLESLPSPRSAPLPADGRSSVPAAFAALRRDAMAEFYERSTCWWVPSQDATRPPRALLRRGLPAPAEYASMVAPDGNDRLSSVPREAVGEAS